MSFTKFVSSIFLIWLIIASRSVIASDPIQCSTSNGKYNFTIDEGHVSFNLINTNIAQRSIAQSRNSNSIRMKRSFRFDGKLFEISIKNKKAFNSFEDELVITTNYGHQMSYPLECK